MSSVQSEECLCWAILKPVVVCVCVGLYPHGLRCRIESLISKCNTLEILHASNTVVLPCAVCKQCNIQGVFENILVLELKIRKKKTLPPGVLFVLGFERGLKFESELNLTFPAKSFPCIVGLYSVDWTTLLKSSHLQKIYLSVVGTNSWKWFQNSLVQSTLASKSMFQTCLAGTVFK